MDVYGKPNIELQDVFIEHEIKPRFTRKFGVFGTRWYAPVAIKIYDHDRNQYVADWFYLFVCSPAFLEKPISNIEPNMKYTLVQEQLDIDAVKKEALSRFENINPQTWDEFYEQMKPYFINEDGG